MAQTEIGRRRRYSTEERDEILRSAKQQGLTKVAREHNVPQSTIYNWRRKREKMPSPSSEPVSTPSVEQSEPGADIAESQAEQSKQAARRYTPSQKAEALEYVAKHGVSLAQRKLNISRFSLHKWKRQAEKAATGQGPSPTSGPDLRKNLVAARADGRGLWPHDATGGGIDWAGASSLPELMPLWPKLWRRLEKYTQHRDFRDDSDTLGEFEEFLEMQPDRLLIVSESRITDLEDITEVQGDTLSLPFATEDLIVFS